ncbi:abscisic acid 8'-hydroxylase 4-like [Carica papaya]|uniref:abscisic acid 8'-hydroxylase 4-like n=1 Tax=Carica papaya TaxID=3649 RepID=UPI000B8CC0A8|nr:abscisic acid 8'-hydroxylase 4-like [Carica papaya]
MLLFPLILLTSIVVGKSEKKRMKNLPPGSMGWPYIGESLKLYSQNPDVFFQSRLQRYGEIFKTHLLGCPCVMVASPEAVKFVLVTQSRLFKPTYPPSKEKLIGSSAIFFQQAGAYHTRIRKLVQASLNLDIIRTLIPDIEAIALLALNSCCAGGRVINTFRQMKKFTFDVATLIIFGQLETSYKAMLEKNYRTLDKGYNSFPINLPGTPYKKSLLARKRIGQILREIIRSRKLEERGLLGSLMKFECENGERLSDDEIGDNVIGVLFAAQDTTASVLTWILKYIHDDSNLLESIKAEQKAFYESNDGGKRPLTWTQARNMPLTSRVIMESLRMASIISFTFREAVQDVEYKGFLIPKGWKVLPLFRNLHHDPDFFTHPNIFDPSRFEVGLKASTYMPFGTGVHACPGNEVAKLEMLILIHHLVNKFRWEVVGSGNRVEYAPFPMPKGGLPARFWKDESCSQG